MYILTYVIEFIISGNTHMIDVNQHICISSRDYGVKSIPQSKQCATRSDFHTHMIDVNQYICISSRDYGVKSIPQSKQCATRSDYRTHMIDVNQHICISSRDCGVKSIPQSKQCATRSAGTIADPFVWSELAYTYNTCESTHMHF